MEWKEGEKYFFKLEDKTCLNGTIVNVDDSLGFVMITLIDKYDKEVGFRADNIVKFELTTPINSGNNKSC